MPYFLTNCTFEYTSDTWKLAGFVGETSLLLQRDSNESQDVSSKNMRTLCKEDA